MNARWVVLSVVAILPIASGLQAGDGKPPVVEVVRPVERTIADFEDFTGRTEAAERVELRARVTGFLNKVNFKPGDSVVKGQVLFELDDRPYRARFDAAKAGLALGDAKVKLFSAELKRAEALLKIKAIAQEDYDKIVTELEVGKAERILATVKVEQAQIDVDSTRVSAPINGRIGEAFLTVGNLVFADETKLAHLGSVAPAYAYFDVEERTYLKLRQMKSPAKVTMKRAADTDQAFQGVVDFVDSRVNAETGTVRCRAVFENADGKLMPGMFVRMRVPTSTPRQALLVESTALRKDGEGTHVLVVDSKNRIAVRPVTTGKSLDGMTEVKTGLTGTDLVLVKLEKGLKVGTIVQAVQREAAPQKAPEPRPEPGKLKELKKARHEVLTKAVTAVMVRYRNGTAGFEAVVMAHRTLVQADLDWCETHAERIAHLLENVKTAQALHKLIEARARVDGAQPGEELQARALVLEAQIRLLRGAEGK
jgi:RND family efflux transporter MFP subunit